MEPDHFATIFQSTAKNARPFEKEQFKKSLSFPGLNCAGKDAFVDMK